MPWTVNVSNPYYKEYLQAVSTQVVNFVHNEFRPVTGHSS